MPTDIVMPQMGESIFEGTITKWLKQPGDKVQRDEPLFEISTDKVDAEIPAPASGTLQEIKVEAGNTVQVNTVVGVISGDGDGRRRCPAPLRPRKPRRKPHRPSTAPPAQLLLRRSPKPNPRPANRAECAPVRWCARSPRRTTSIWRRFPVPDSAAASPRKTSRRSSPSTPQEPQLPAGGSRAGAPGPNRSRIRGPFHSGRHHAAAARSWRYARRSSCPCLPCGRRSPST